MRNRFDRRANVRTRDAGEFAQDFTEMLRVGGEVSEKSERRLQLRYAWRTRWTRNSPLFGKIAPPMPPTSPPAPTCDQSMKHAQLEYSRNKHCDFLRSFAKDSGVVSANKKGRITFGAKKVPADLAVQAFAKSNTIEGECRIISLVRTTPEGESVCG